MFWVSLFGTVICTAYTGIMCLVGVRASDSRAETVVAAVGLVGAVAGII